MRFWLTSFFVLFALAQFVDWLRSLQVPFGVFVAGGVLLAIVSNYDRRALFPFWSELAATRASLASKEPAPAASFAEAEPAAEPELSVDT